ncbi:MAG: 16S rRNA (guanine(527)-N(7))-methyltransferase RsmG [Pseudomonadota bacterium]
MQIGSTEWNAIVSDGASMHGVTVSSAQMTFFAAYAQTLLAWNERTNLTRIVAADEVAIRHFVDSLALIPHLGGCRNIMDIGTGGGFPGMVVAAMMPESRVVLVDAVRKKISFLQYLIRARGVPNVDAIHARADDIHLWPQFQKSFDAVVSRALGDLPVTLRAASPFAGENARIIAMRGPQGADECDGFMASAEREAMEDTLGYHLMVSVFVFNLPQGHGQRHLLVFERNRSAL